MDGESAALRPGGDAALVELVQRGFRYALALTHDPTQAEDLVQDAALALLRSQAPPTAPMLFTILRNRFVDQLRRDERVEPEGLERADDAQVAAALDARLDERDTGRLDRALARLRPEEREVLMLACVEDLTCAQIAELFGRPRGTVTSLLFRAQRKVREALGYGTREAAP